MSRPLQHLLLVEDDFAWRERLTVVAHAEGVKVSHAADGQEALDWLCTRPRASHPDLILLDLLLPRMDGWELYGQLRTNARLRHLGVLMFSGGLSGQEPPLDGVVGYLRKPHAPEDVDGALRAQLRGLPQLPARDSAEPYALHMPEDVSLPLRTLPGALSHAVRLHLLRAAELTGTELPLASTWLMALPGTPPSLLVTVDGVQVELEVDDEQRRLTVRDVTLSPNLLHGA